MDRDDGNALYLTISRKLTEFSQAVDTQDLEALADLFTADAVMDLPAGLDGGPERSVLEGREAILSRWSVPRDFATRHLVSNVTVSERRDGTVEARSTGIGLRGAPGDVGSPQLIAVSDFTDRLARQDGEWRFLSRRVDLVFCWTRP